MLSDRGAQRVIVGVDGSEAALAAAAWGAEEAAQHDVSLTLLYVVDRNRAATPNVVEAENQLAETAVADANAVVETLQKPIEVERDIICGDPGTVLLQQSRSAALLCVGAPKAHPHGPSDSLAASVASAASCSVAVVPPTRCAAWKRPGLLAVCLDSSNINYDALQVALEEAHLHRFSLRVVAKESSDPALDGLVSKWARSYRDIDTRIVQSDDILSYISGQHGLVHMVVSGAEREAAELIELSRSRAAFYENPAVLVVNSQHL